MDCIEVTFKYHFVHNYYVRRKVYGQSKSDVCVFCKKTATVENEQGLPTCKDHKHQSMEDKRCVCGEYMDVKKGKWGAFYLCPNCGPKSISKVEETETEQGSFKLNKRFRQGQKEKVYTLDELEQIWEDRC